MGRQEQSPKSSVPSSAMFAEEYIFQLEPSVVTKLPKLTYNFAVDASASIQNTSNHRFVN